MLPCVHYRSNIFIQLSVQLQFSENGNKKFGEKNIHSTGFILHKSTKLSSLIKHIWVKIQELRVTV